MGKTVKNSFGNKQRKTVGILCNMLIISLLSLSCGCIISEQPNNTSNFEQKIDSLKQFIPTISENHNFSFAEISENEWEWQKSQKFVEIDSSLWIDYFDKPTLLVGYKYYYQTNYYYKIIDFHDNFINMIILQHIHNNNESYMYLLQFDKHGNRQKAITLASIFKSRDEYEEVKSSIQSNKITTYSFYEDFDERTIKKDTTLVIW